MSRILNKQKMELIKYGNVSKAVDEGLDKSFLEMAARIVTEAKGAVPVDLGVLGASIMASTNLDPEYGYGVAPPDAKGGGEAPPRISRVAGEHEAYVGSAVNYALYQEFGTRNMAAQPFLRPAIQIVAGHGKAKDIIAKYNSKEVTEAVMRAHKAEVL